MLDSENLSTCTFSIDWKRTDGNLLAVCGSYKTIKVYDIRQMSVAKTLENIFSSERRSVKFRLNILFKKSGWIRVVKWDPSGTCLAAGGEELSVKVIDFATEKINYSKFTDSSRKNEIFFIDMI